MGQPWNLLNVDRREKDLAGGGKLGEFFFENMSSLYESLLIPCLPKDLDVWLSRGAVAVQPGPIGKLSTEVLDMVFELLLDDSDPDSSDPNEDFLDCIIFAISCKKFLTIGTRHILRTLIARHARAADCRLLEEIATTPDPEEDFDYPSVEEAVAHRCLSHFAGETYTPAYMVHVTLLEPFRKTVDALYKLQRKKPAGTGALFSALDVEMIRKLGGVGPWGALGLEYAEGPRVLCNTVKGEYVREDTLVVWRTRLAPVTLAHALLARVCYSPDDSTALCCAEDYNAALAKGPWAGDRFRIVTVDEMPPLMGGKTWKDVTREVNALLCHLLEGEFPEYRKAKCSQKEGGGKEIGEKGTDDE